MMKYVVNNKLGLIFGKNKKFIKNIGVAAHKHENDKLESKGYSFVEFEEHKFAIEAIKSLSGRAAKNVFKNVSSSNKILIADLAVEKIDALKKKEKLKKIQKEKAALGKISNSETTKKDKKSSDQKENEINEENNISKTINSNIDSKNDTKKPEKLGRGARQREKKKLLKSKLENDEITEDE